MLQRGDVFLLRLQMYTFCTYYANILTIFYTCFTSWWLECRRWGGCLVACSRSEHRARNERGGSDKRAFPSVSRQPWRSGRDFSRQPWRFQPSAVAVGSGWLALLGSGRQAGTAGSAFAPSGGFFLGLPAPRLPLAVPPLAVSLCLPFGSVRFAASGATASGKTWLWA